MLCITRSHVHVDRVACPWLIKRFVDSEAQFVFVPKSEVSKRARDTGAIPFDAPDVELGHKNGKCSFETIVERFGLTDPALARLARIVHAADIASDLRTDQLGPGLQAIATGFGLAFAAGPPNLAPH